MAGRKNLAGMEMTIGFTVVAALVILMVMLFVWGNNSSFLDKHYWAVVEMNNVSGLREGAPVKIGGFQIGKVSAIELDSNSRNIVISLSIDDNRRIPRDSMAKIGTSGLVGDSFLDIIPGHSEDNLKRAASKDAAERIQSAPPAELSDLMLQANTLGTKLNSILDSLNKLLGNGDFLDNINQIANNLAATSAGAKNIALRSTAIADNIERTSENVVALTSLIHERILSISENVLALSSLIHERVLSISGNLGTTSENLAAVSGTIQDRIDGITDNVNHLIDRIGEIATTAGTTVTNINGGVDDIRQGISRTLANPEFTGAITSSAHNIAELTGSLNQHKPELEKIIDNLAALSDNLRISSKQLDAIIANVEPEQVATGFNALTGTLASISELVEKIRNDPVLALSINKAADRIVKMKFDEMAKSPNFKTSDQTLQEIKRWTSQALERGNFPDPGFSPERRPYLIDP
ncbi:MAG: MlaD family protein [Planctomycetota bacterium]|jgi:phospholipid/cholesterol/gamma-HCH transport system substrate-binding protein|nr:MlaD family protein [Planctomycetota bacterium]